MPSLLSTDYETRTHDELPTTHSHSLLLYSLLLLLLLPNVTDRHRYFTTPRTIEYIYSEAAALTTSIDTATDEDKLAQFQQRGQLLCSTVQFNSWLDTVRVPVLRYAYSLAMTY